MPFTAPNFPAADEKKHTAKKKESGQKFVNYVTQIAK